MFSKWLQSASHIVHILSNKKLRTTKKNGTSKSAPIEGHFWKPLLSDKYLYLIDQNQCGCKASWEMSFSLPLSLPPFFLSCLSLSPTLLHALNNIGSIISWLFGKDPDAREDWGQEERGWPRMKWMYHWLNAHEFEQTLGDGEGHKSLALCSSWDHKELDTINNWRTIRIDIGQATFCLYTPMFHIKQLL